MIYSKSDLDSSEYNQIYEVSNKGGIENEGNTCYTPPPIRKENEKFAQLDLFSHSTEFGELSTLTELSHQLSEADCDYDFGKENVFWMDCDKEIINFGSNLPDAVDDYNIFTNTDFEEIFEEFTRQQNYIHEIILNKNDVNHELFELGNFSETNFNEIFDEFLNQSINSNGNIHQEQNLASTSNSNGIFHHGFNHSEISSNSFDKNSDHFDYTNYFEETGDRNDFFYENGIEIDEHVHGCIIHRLIWTYIVDPFCAPTAFCSILMNNEIFMKYISNLNDIFSIFLKDSVQNYQNPFDLLAIPPILWRTDPIDIASKSYSEYAKIPGFNIFDMKITLENQTHYLSSICVDIRQTFELTINGIEFKTHGSIVTLSFNRFIDGFKDYKFCLPSQYIFIEKLLDLSGFIYVINPLSTASHYISVIKKGFSYYKCDGKPIEILNIIEFMNECYIVASFYTLQDYDQVLNPSDIYDEGAIFSLDDYKHFKFHSTNPFICLHPEYNNLDYVDDLITFNSDPTYIPSESSELDATSTSFSNEESQSPMEQDFEKHSESYQEKTKSPKESDFVDINSESIQYETLNIDNFLSVNRFLYDALMILEKPTIENVSILLEMSQYKLRDNLAQHKIISSMKKLKKIAENIELLDPPPVYNFLSKIIHSDEEIQIDSMYIELIIPFTYYHFDHHNLLFNRSTFPLEIKSKIPNNFDFSFIDPDIMHFFGVDNEQDCPNKSNDFSDFHKIMIDLYDHMPSIFKNIDGDQRFIINSNISIAFLYGNVEIAKAGIGSPHLKGTFSMSARKHGTGYLNLDSILNSRSRNPPDIEKLKDIMNWLKLNNPLYADIAPLTTEFYTTRIEPAFAPRNEVIGIAQLPNEYIQSNSERNIDYNKIPISMADAEGNKVLKYVYLEEALSLCFPMLFPKGLIMIIPGKTLREKSLALLSSHEFYRCGRLQCSLILFLYNTISSHNASFIQNKLSLQRTHIPIGASRDIPTSIMLRNDPSMPEYWLNRQAQVRAMCSELGDPDLMITFTFVNKWPEVKELEDRINELGFDKVDIRFCPFEEMMIWNERFSEIKTNGFNELIKFMNFGHASNYCWRLEFQARGAPHVHALIWLEKRLSLDAISKNFFAHIPDEKTPLLYGLVLNNMVHNCILNRCKGGIESASCKYGFPKPSCINIHADNDGKIILSRNDDESRIIEYSPYFIIKWGGHCHINILLFEDHIECSCNAIHYIVKYNFKHEPNLTVEVVDNNNLSYKTRFHARVISVEEATTKIASVDYFGSSMASLYITIKSPEQRQATFKSGEQTQITNIEKYFNRPPELERMGILSFFSNFNITPIGITNQQRTDQIRNQFRVDPESHLKATRPTRPHNSLNDNSNWEQENLPSTKLIKNGMLFPAQNLPNARALKINLRTKPQIILTERFSCTSNIEEFSYVYLMLSGSWRSDEEMKAGQNSWIKALEYHGLSLPCNDGMLQYFQLLIKFMINSPRYSNFDLLRTISMMNYDMIPYLLEIKETSGTFIKSKIEEIICELKRLKQANLTFIEDINVLPDYEIMNKYIRYSFNDDEINKSAKKLNYKYMENFNDEQRLIFNNIQERLLAGQQVMAFTQGKAGTGKSFLIKAIINFLKANRIPHIVCASTGMAASLIKGKTVHSSFGIYSMKSSQENDNVCCSLDISKPNGFAMSRVKVIIVDEATMISGKVFGAMEEGLRRIMAQIRSPLQSSQFGGKSILLFGDLAQVPAVTRSNSDFLESIAQFHENPNFERFTIWKLNKIMRQNPNELILLKILDFVRDHTDNQILDKEIEEELKKIFLPGLIENVIDKIDNFVGGDDINGMVITFTNKSAQLYNQLILEKRIRETNCLSFDLNACFYVNEKTHFISNNNESDSISLQKQASLVKLRIATEGEKGIFRNAMKKHLVNSIIPFSLTIIPNARVMLLQNLDLNIGLINGARGTVIQYIKEIDAIEVKFDFQAINESPIVITRRKSMEYQINKGKIIFMYMFPLKLSWAVTAHKSQGQTLSKCAINIGEIAFAHGQLYVSLSRVRTLDSLMLYGLEQWPEGGPNFHMNPFIQSKANLQAENEFI